MSIDDGVYLRAAEARRGALRLAPIYIGSGATVCTRAVVGPGASVPANACLGPYMSWRELDTTAPGAAAAQEAHTMIARQRMPKPSIIFRSLFATPFVCFVSVVHWLPWWGGAS